MGEIKKTDLHTELQTELDKIGILTTKVNPETPLNTTSQDLSGAVNEVNTKLGAHEADKAKYAKFTILANQSVANDINTDIVWTTKAPYNGEDFSEIDATGKIKILKSGIYQINFTAQFVGNANGYRTLWGGLLNTWFPTTAYAAYMSLSYFQYINANTLLTTRVRQNSGSALDLIGTSVGFEIRKVA